MEQTETNYKGWEVTVKRALVTYAAGAHEELLDISLPLFKDFAQRHRYDMIVGKKLTDMPPAWNKIPLLLAPLLANYNEVVWLDCDLVIVNPNDDFPPLDNSKAHSLVRHFEDHSEVPNSGVWRLNPEAESLLYQIKQLDVFHNHGWWEQAALMTLMGYTVPPEGTEFSETKCRCVHPTFWYSRCQFMRVKWNSHPNYRADKDVRIVHCSYPNMLQRIEVMRELVRNPSYNYPKYSKGAEPAQEDKSD